MHLPTPEHARLTAKAMYRPEFERDAYGVGLVAATNARLQSRHGAATSPLFMTFWLCALVGIGLTVTTPTAAMAQSDNTRISPAVDDAHTVANADAACTNPAFLIDSGAFQIVMVNLYRSSPELARIESLSPGTLNELAGNLAGHAATAYRHRKAAICNNFAQAYRELLPDEALAKVAAFYRTPAGQALTQGSSEQLSMLFAQMPPGRARELADNPQARGEFQLHMGQQATAAAILQLSGENREIAQNFLQSLEMRQLLDLYPQILARANALNAPLIAQATEEALAAASQGSQRILARRRPAIRR